MVVHWTTNSPLFSMVVIPTASVNFSRSMPIVRGPEAQITNSDASGGTRMVQLVAGFL
jgi:hypothetical protein